MTSEFSQSIGGSRGIHLKVVAASRVVEIQAEWTSKAPRNPNQVIECLQVRKVLILNGYNFAII